MHIVLRSWALKTARAQIISNRALHTFDSQGQPAQRIIEHHRKAEFTTPIPNRSLP